MKKTIMMLGVVCALTVSASYAQEQPKQEKKKTETENTKTKVKPKTTVKDKAHNIIHPKDKISHGTKIKHKSDEGKVKAEVTPSKQ